MSDGKSTDPTQFPHTLARLLEAAWEQRSSPCGANYRELRRLHALACLQAPACVAIPPLEEAGLPEVHAEGLLGFVGDEGAPPKVGEVPAYRRTAAGNDGQFEEWWGRVVALADATLELAGPADVGQAGRQPPSGDTAGPGVGMDGEFLGIETLAQLFHVDAKQLRYRVEAWRKKNPQQEGHTFRRDPAPARGQPRYTYLVGTVRPIIDDLLRADT